VPENVKAQSKLPPSFLLAVSGCKNLWYFHFFGMETGLASIQKKEKESVP